MAKIFSQLEKAQLENTTSDTASHPKGMITYRTDINQAKVSNGTTYKLLIDEDSTQTLSNKTYASPITSGAITAAQTTTPANPSSGSNKLYFKADGKLYTLDSAGNEALVGSGAGGGVKNLITNGNADDTSSSIFVPYADAAATRPVDGTGGSPTVTTSVTSSSPLDGTKSFLLTKTAVNSQGQGWAIPFTVDTAYKAKALKISADFIVNSGTFVAGSNGTSPTDGDVIWYIYDVTNSQLIEPSNIKMFSNSSSLSDKFEATFQSSATGSSYRLIAHVASTSALAFELKVDNVTVSPQTYVYGTPVTDVKTYTPTLNSNTNVSNNSGWYARVGDCLVGRVSVTYSGAGAASRFEFSLPSGLSIDTSKVKNVNYGSNTVGTFSITTSTFRVGFATASSSTSIGIIRDSDIGTFLSSSFGAGDIIEILFNVPILGWSSSVQMSDSADTRVVTARIYKNGTQTYSSQTKLTSWTIDSDKTGMWDATNNRFNITSAGDYEIFASLYATAATTANQQFVYKVNGGAAVYVGNAPNTSGAINASFGGSDIIPNLKSGDYVEVFGYADASVTLQAGLASTRISFKRISGPVAIAANESITMKYTNTAGTSMSGSIAVLPFATKSYDSHSAWDGSKFVCPTSGKYSVKTSIVLNNVTMTTGQNTGVLVYKNGVQENYLGIVYGNGGALNYAVGGSVDLQCVAGDYIEVRAYSGGTTPSLNTTAGINYVCISRIGS